MRTQRTDLRNLAIIAHVDHGKTTLVDAMLKQSRVFREHQQVGSLILDSHELERERGITILAKNTAIRYRNVKINIIDTPGHADFGSEVERVLTLADGCLLLVDAVEGPMPQTRYVLKKALALGLRPIVGINKVDRPRARPLEALEATQDLFLEVATDADQLEFPVVYLVAKEGRAGVQPDALAPDLTPLFETILAAIPCPTVERDAPVQALIAALDYDPHLGRIAIGRLMRGTLRTGAPVVRVRSDGAIAPESGRKVRQLLVFEGLKRVEVTEIAAGEIVALVGLDDVAIGDTIADPAFPEPLPAIAVDEPTVRITLGVNTSPFAGREGKYQTSRQLRDRLERELETNLGLRVEETESPDRFLLSGRGELHLSILIETMRREGYEFEVSRPEVIVKRVDGQLQEPVEELVIDTTDEYVGAVAELVGPRLARLVNIRHRETSAGTTDVRLVYRIPTRGLIGLRTQLLTATRGNATMSTLFLGYEPWQGPLAASRGGALIATESGRAVAYGLASAQERGQLFIEPGTEVYEGMIVGVAPRALDIPVNVCRQKKATNIRSSTAEIAVKLTPPRRLSLEDALDFLAADELLEVTPKSLRLRKRLLSEHERARARKQEAKAALAL
ncbi:MAG: translational GTPase TypA [Chloroflexota bacterium]|nr:translational GTPase TypA [Dehalococcoidia bacterium]MDW8253647.1 translational GTPase TypA [Chloroflexota bacterium]